MIALSSTMFGGSVDGLHYLPDVWGLFLSLFLLHHLYRRSINTCKLLLASSRSHGSFKLRLVTLYWHFCLLHHAFIHFFVRRFGIHSLFCCSCFWYRSTTRWRPEPRGILGRHMLLSRKS